MSKYNDLLLYTLLLCLSACSTYTHLAGTSVTSERISATPDSAVENLVRPYKNSLDFKMNEVLAQCPETMTKEKPESTLTNWVADALYHQAGKIYNEPIAFTFQNFGGIRIGTLGQGPVTLGKIFEIMPFDNAFVLLKLTGTEVLKLLQYIAEGGGLPVSSSVTMTISGKKIISVKIHQKEIDPKSTYYIGMTDYIANGGDNLSFLIPLPRIEKNILVRDMLVVEAKEKGVIGSALDQRISIQN